VTGISYTPDQAITCFKIIIDPANSNRLYVLANNIVYRSLDGGTSFDNIYTLVNQTCWNCQRNLRDIKMKPGDPNTLYITADCSGAGGGSVILRTTNATAISPISPTWTPIATGYDFSNVQRIGLAVSPKDPNCLFAAYQDTPQYNAGDMLVAGKTYKVINNNIIYNGATYFIGNTINVLPGNTTFTSADITKPGKVTINIFYILKSTSSGASWIQYLSKTGIIDSYGEKFAGLGFWRLELEVSPTDLDVIYVGGV